MTHKIKGTQNISRDCMVCGVENGFGLKTRFHETENDEVIAVFTPRHFHQSYPKITHGGITAAILDETIGRAIMCHYDNKTFGVTVELNVKYKRPVPYEVELKVVGRITNDNGRLFEGSGELFLPDGTLAASAEGKYMKRSLEQFTDAAFIDNDWFTPEDCPEEITVQNQENGKRQV
ncbi:PaaI family thioesterase [uncultured Desulfuromonas sp.]|uniref:PaaI family thioesterase n=1 Tax=uncultured Desulfuromonas sp. TaxID=181013 RepID=UPI00261E33D7|nr:PaaI family thioesterase [uncultured Desulfuromonas sp.]